VHDPAMPGHVLRQAHIHRQQTPGPPIHDHQLRSLSGRPTRNQSGDGQFPGPAPAGAVSYSRWKQRRTTAPAISATATARWAPSVAAGVGGRGGSIGRA
jgi:hypothetical protein